MVNRLQCYFIFLATIQFYRKRFRNSNQPSSFLDKYVDIQTNKYLKVDSGYVLGFNTVFYLQTFSQCLQLHALIQIRADGTCVAGVAAPTPVFWEIY